MGFFTSFGESSNKNSNKYPTLPPRQSLTAPPNVYYTPPHPSGPELPQRPLTANPPSHPPAPYPAPAPHPFYAQHHVGYPQPQSGPADHYLSVPAPAPGWPQAPVALGPGVGQHPYGAQPVVVNQHYYSYTEPTPQTWAQYPESHYHQPQHHESQQQERQHQESEQQRHDNGASETGQSHDAVDSSSTMDELYHRFNKILTMIDREHLSSHDGDPLPDHPAPNPEPDQLPSIPEEEEDEHTTTDRSMAIRWPSRPSRDRYRGQVPTAVLSDSYISKVELYANSRLPMNLAPLALYMATWPLLCLAAKYSLRVYDSPSSSSSSSSSSDLQRRNTHIFTTSWRTAHRALLIKSIPFPHTQTILLSIRGTASFTDWAVNVNSSPSQPTNFLDDEGNACHAGFLSLARGLIKPIASRLRKLLEDDPTGMSSYSLLLTGHSAGGAVAALLYAHMLSTSPQAESELSILTGCFKRIHCITFGAPPISLLPLKKPSRADLRNSLFLSFVNEGDPVVRADKPYVKSLLDLLASPPPSPKPIDARLSTSSLHLPAQASSSSLALCTTKTADMPPQLPPRRPTWPVPPCTLSNAGTIIVLRDAEPYTASSSQDRKTVGERLADGVVAVTCREEQLRDMIWGDPVAHMMSLYAGRIEALAVEAVMAATAGEGGEYEDEKKTMVRKW